MLHRLLPTLRWAAGAQIGAHARRCVSTTAPTLEKHTIKVPSMGDSITEGTIIEWTAQAGQMVKEGDVVALVETDKVTVDIKAEMDGVLMKQFGEVDDTVEVGADLYELDTEAEASVVAAEPAEVQVKKEEPQPVVKATPVQVKKEEPQPVVKATPVQTKEAKKSRVPSIKFLGKDGWAQVLSGANAAVIYVPPNYGRPKFSEDEMEALVTGGANIAPVVKKHSSGAMFG